MTDQITDVAILSNDQNIKGVERKNWLIHCHNNITGWDIIRLPMCIRYDLNETAVF